MKEVLEKPRSKDQNRVFREPLEWSPSLFVLDDPKLLKSFSLQSQIFIRRRRRVFERMPVNLSDDCISEVGKMPGHSLDCEAGVGSSSSTPCNDLERRYHSLHSMEVLLVSVLEL